MQELDSALCLWFQARRSEGRAVSGPALMVSVSVSNFFFFSFKVHVINTMHYIYTQVKHV